MKIPEIQDKTDAFFRRLIIINFTQQFFAEKDDPHILEKLCTEEEFSGLLHELLGRLPRIIKRGIRPTTNETMAETYEKYVRGSNPMQYFVEKALTVIDASGKTVPKDQMYESYRWFCRDKKIAPESEQSFSRKLTKEFRFQYKKYRKEGSSIWCWENVKLVNWKALEDELQQTLTELTDEQREELN
jgi:putative DNA primase/helicase